MLDTVSDEAFRILFTFVLGKRHAACRSRQQAPVVAVVAVGKILSAA